VSSTYPSNCDHPKDGHPEKRHHYEERHRANQKVDPSDPNADDQTKDDPSNCDHPRDDQTTTDPNADGQKTADLSSCDHPRDDHREKRHHYAAHHHANQKVDPTDQSADDQKTADPSNCDHPRDDPKHRAKPASNQACPWALRLDDCRAYRPRIWVTRTNLASSEACRTTYGRSTHLNVASP
jgi:hypothetical protein